MPLMLLGAALTARSRDRCSHGCVSLHVGEVIKLSRTLSLNCMLHSSDRNQCSKWLIAESSPWNIVDPEVLFSACYREERGPGSIHVNDTSKCVLFFICINSRMNTFLPQRANVDICTGGDQPSTWIDAIGTTRYCAATERSCAVKNSRSLVWFIAYDCSE